MVREAIEAMIALVVVWGLSWWIPSSWKPSHMIFCAFFLVVFAVAVRYQTGIAYGISMLAAISYAILLQQSPALRALPTFLYFALEPFLILMSGILISDLLRWQRHRLKTLERRQKNLQETLQETQRQYQASLERNLILEQQINGQAVSIATLSDKMVTLWKETGNERYSAIVDIVFSALEVQSCACYLYQNGVFHLCGERSIENVAHSPLLHKENALVKRAIERHEVCTIRDSLLEERNASPDMPVMVGPLLDQGGTLVGVIVIGSMPLLKFTSGTVRLFRSILQMVSFSLQCAEPVA